MNNGIVAERAKIVEVAHRIHNGSVTSKLKVVAIATAKIAKAIGARWLLDRDALVKQGFTSVELDYLLKNVRVTHTIDKLASVELISEMVSNFKVFRKGDDAKKAKKLMVSFFVHHTGSPFEMLEHLMKIGAGEGVFTVTPLQKELFADQPKGGRKPKQGTLATASDVDRKASARREKRKKRTPDRFVTEMVIQESAPA